jgi:predicted nuclease with TOPRIM domain
MIEKATAEKLSEELTAAQLSNVRLEGRVKSLQDEVYELERRMIKQDELWTQLVFGLEEENRRLKELIIQADLCRPRFLVLEGSPVPPPSPPGS